MCSPVAPKLVYLLLRWPAVLMRYPPVVNGGEDVMNGIKKFFEITVANR